MLARKAARWAADHVSALEGADPGTPAALNDRMRDNWYPLLAIADAAGGAWPEEARRAAVALAGTDGEDSLATELLADVRGLFAAADAVSPKPVEKLSSTRMVGELINSSTGRRRDAADRQAADGPKDGGPAGPLRDSAQARGQGQFLPS